jgi:hypothetical protein
MRKGRENISHAGPIRDKTVRIFPTRDQLETRPGLYSRNAFPRTFQGCRPVADAEKHVLSYKVLVAHTSHTNAVSSASQEYCCESLLIGRTHVCIQDYLVISTSDNSI